MPNRSSTRALPAPCPDVAQVRFARTMPSALAAAALLLLLSGVTQAQQGLGLQPPKLGALSPVASAATAVTDPALEPGALRLDLQVPRLGAGGAGARLFGDYYLTGPGFGEGSVSGGLRLTSGVTLGPRGEARSLPPPRLLGGLFAGLRHGETFGDAPGLHDGERIALPYVGLGYTTLSARGGWGVSADIGLGGMRPGERLRLGASGASVAQVEDILNRLRLAPVLQLGVSYAF